MTAGETMNHHYGWPQIVVVSPVFDGAVWSDNDLAHLILALHLLAVLTVDVTTLDSLTFVVAFFASP